MQTVLELLASADLNEDDTIMYTSIKKIIWINSELCIVYNAST